jgi:hypothetical protein
VRSLLISSIGSRERSRVSQGDNVPHRTARLATDVENKMRNSAGSPPANVALAHSSKLHLSRNRCGKSFILPWKRPRRWSESPNGSGKSDSAAPDIRLLISPRNPYAFFLTICTPPCSSGSCAAPRYPENKQSSLCIPQIRYVRRGAICSVPLRSRSPRTRTVN